MLLMSMFKALTTEHLRHEACTILDYIIEHIPERKLRASFTALPKVKAII
jgi:hypothetical protein